MGGHEGYLTVGQYESGHPGELFITMAKEGSTVGGMMDAFATAISLCLQFGVPLDDLVKKFTHQRFEPSGMTSSRDIPFAKSVVDYIFRWLGLTFLEEYRKTNLPNRKESAAPAGGAKKAKTEAVKDDASSEGESAVRTSATEAQGFVGAPEGGRYVSFVPGEGRLMAPAGAVAAGTSGRELMSHRVIPQYERGDQQFSHYQEDAPACDVCGSITVRNGNCYKCYNCGTSWGCS